MSLNMRFGIDPNKTKYYGPLFHTIDFEMIPTLSAEIYLEHTGRHKRRKVGTFFIGNSKYNVTMNKLQNIVNELALIEDKTYRQKPKKVVIDLFNNEIEVTRHEYFRILETARGAINIIKKSYAMGTLL